MLYIKYNLKPKGMRTPFTGYRIFEDNEKKEKTGSGYQEIYQKAKVDNQENGQRQR
jgi:hypothetical protein